RPALTLKGQQGSARGKGAIRKVLVVSQFSISVALLIATAITIQQLSYLNSKDLGFDKDQVVTLSYFSELQPNYDAFYNELMRSSGIKNAGRSSRIPTGRLLDSQGAPRIAMGDSLVNTEITTKNVRVDESFFPTYNIPFVAGRNFSKSIGTDDSLAFIVNETAAKAYGLATPEEGINKDFSYGGVTGKLIGVVKDFHFESLHQGIIPIVFHQ
ncbi:MAG TPA: ABC transporter permease, partial [Cyclobacteriaceae bacterium]|nr:ABC transporter permease [Cyclobacteriaceae bacterium]